jgi:DNA methylase
MCGDACQILKQLPNNVVDAVVTDPPYGIGFMSRSWDAFNYDIGDTGDRRSRHKKDSFRNRRRASLANQRFQRWCEAWARHAFRVLKPGGHLLAFGGTRTYHRLVCGLEEAGFEVRDSIHWVYANGFPKNLDISKAIDKAAGRKRQVIGRKARSQSMGAARFGQSECAEYVYSLPATDGARKWHGWGTGLKPAHELICVARKPLSEPTVPANVLRHGTGAINIDACRIEPAHQEKNVRLPDKSEKNSRKHFNKRGHSYWDLLSSQAGRWPSNFILSHKRKEPWL